MTEIEQTAVYRRYLLAARSGSSQYGWDHYIRPVVWALVDRGFGDHAVSWTPERLGEELYQLIDPNVTICHDRQRRGPGNEPLVRIVETMETSLSLR